MHLLKLFEESNFVKIWFYRRMLDSKLILASVFPVVIFFNFTVSHMTCVYAKHGLWVVWMGYISVEEADSVRNRPWMGYIFVEEGDSIRNGASFTIYNLPYKQMITANA